MLQPIRLFLLLILMCFRTAAPAQHLLGRVISVSLADKDVPAALDAITKASGIPFSYKSDILMEGKKVTLNAQGKTVKYVLDQIFEGGFHYTEKGRYIILHAGGEKSFVISGYIQDGRTGKRIGNVTVYEDQILASTLTNENGYFRLPIRNRSKLKTISIIARKEAYSESFVALNAGYDQELVLPILPSSEIVLEDVVIKGDSGSGWISRMLLSSRQKIQNLNIGSFIAKRPVQTSLLPGIGTHGLMGAQVVNKFSLNILGGYTAGVNGFELGSLFNIDKGSVRYVQVGGIFNMVSGNVQGFQAAGIYNYTEGNAGGFQTGGISNIVKGNMKAVQVAGISNTVGGNANGIQVAGIANLNSHKMKGIQISGIVNANRDSARGVQLAGLSNIGIMDCKGLFIAGLNNHGRRSVKGVQFSGCVNYARNMNGLQVGLLNIADTMSGVGIGLVNYYRNGYHRVLCYADEMQGLNVGYLSGTRRFYCMLVAGANPGLQRSFCAAYGVGKPVRMGEKWMLHTDLLGQVYYIGHWDYVPLALRGQITLTRRIGKLLEVFAGPSFTITETKSVARAESYRSWLGDPGRQYYKLGNTVTGWMGWQAGLRLF